MLEAECGAKSQQLLFEDSERISEELERSLIDTDKDRYFQIRARLPPEEKMELVNFLKSNVNVFAWSAYGAARIDPEFICHQLNVNCGDVPRRQSPRRSSKEHAEAVREEVNKLK